MTTTPNETGDQPADRDVPTVTTMQQWYAASTDDGLIVAGVRQGRTKAVRYDTDTGATRGVLVADQQLDEMERTAPGRLPRQARKRVRDLHGHHEADVADLLLEAGRDE